MCLLLCFAGPRRWRKWCGPCRVACASSAIACPRCGNCNLREIGNDHGNNGAGAVVEEDNDAEDGDDMNDGGDEGMDAGHGDDGEVDDGPKRK